ncbi:MAG TPA: glycosyltransferase [Patescibacteria group bacterium]|nr:glycosyltransferase [Patescibacteria group bacterium]
MTKDSTQRVAIVTSLSGGLGHYAAHLAGPLSKLIPIKFITYPQLDLSGVVVKQVTDSLVRHYIKWPRFDLDDSDPTSIITVSDYLDSRDINLVNIHVGTTVKQKINYFTTFCTYLKQDGNKKLIFTLHDVMPFEESKKLTKLLKAFYGLADYFTVGNEDEKRRLMKYFEIHEDKIAIIPHGIYNLFNRNLYTPQIAKNFVGLPANKQIILFFGFLREYKGLEYLIKAAKIMTKKNNDFVIYVVSGLKFTPKPLLEESLQLINKLGLQDNFMLNFNYLDSLELEIIFKASDIVALPYARVSQSGVERMAFGFSKPVMITDVFSDKTWINKKAGLVAISEDPQSIADKLLQLISNPQEAKEYGIYGNKYCLEHFNWDKIAEKYFEVFEKLSSNE